MKNYVEVAQMVGYRLFADAESLRVKQVFSQTQQSEEYQLVATQYMQLLDEVEEYLHQRRGVASQKAEFRLLAKQRGIEHQLRQWAKPTKS